MSHKFKSFSSGTCCNVHQLLGLADACEQPRAKTSEYNIPMMKLREQNVKSDSNNNSNSEGNNINEVKALLPKVKDIYKYVQLLQQNKVLFDELAFTKRLSKDSNNYQNRNTIENGALTKLNSQEKYLKAGEILQYVITDYYQTRSKQ